MNDHDFEKALSVIRTRLARRQDYQLDSIESPFFGGADVIIDEEPKPHHEQFLANQPLVFDPTGYQARRRVVITHHADRLSALFYQFRDTGFHEIDFGNKFAFYGTLAQAALDYLDEHGDPDDPSPMLQDVFEAGERFLRETRDWAQSSNDR